MSTDSYSKKNISYFINPRLDLVSLLPADPHQKVLEIGMGGGDTLVHIKQQGLASEVVGIDLLELPNTNQQNPQIDKVLFLDLDKDSLPFPDHYFDTIIAGDVLEHLIDPWEVLKKLAKVLKVNGHILVSLPNIRDVYALYSILVKGSFGYTSQGIFDRTHMRFFCKKDMISLLQSVQQLRVETVMPIQNYGNRNYKRKLFNRFSFGLLEEFTTSQYLFSVTKTG